MNHVVGGWHRRGWRLGGGILPSLVLTMGPAVAAETADPPDLRIALSTQAVVKLIEAAVPYALEVDAGLFKQRITLDGPRNISFFDGGIRMEIDAVGTPLPLDAVLEPVLHLERRDGSPEYEVRIESLPVRLGALGTVDLATAIPPIPVQRVSEMLLESRQTSIPLQLEILSIDVGPEGIGIGVRTRYRGEFLSAAPSSGATGRPSD